MAYPNEIDTFTDKLNKSDTVYVIEEEVELINGVYEALLAHDNIVDSSVHVYTGSKLTGDKVDNFILSVPSKEKWKRVIKIFSSVSPVFITYESYGDQIEADDVNRLQTSITATQTEVERYKAANDLVVNNTVNRVTKLESSKADKTYVDSELLKKADKANTYTKTETDARIQAVVDAAPAALDTLNEIAAALNDDPNFAATMTTELSKKVDKVAGKQLSTNDYTTTEKAKLAGIEEEANKYVHPSTHPATMIVEDSTRRFVSDAEKSTWNGKLDATANAVSASKLATGRTIALSGDVTGSVVFDGSGNVTITSTVVDDSHNHVISNIDGLQEALDTKETPAGAQTKATIAQTNAIDWAKSMGLGQTLSARTTSNCDTAKITGFYYVANTATSKPSETTDGAMLVMTYDSNLWVTQLYIDWRTNQHYTRVCSNGVWSSWQVIETQTGAQARVNAHTSDAVKHITAAERTVWNAKSTLALGETSATAYRGDLGKIAYDHSQAAHAPSNAQKNSDITKAEIEAKLTGNITSHSHSQYVTQEQLGNAGYGDMLKSVYDSNGNGIVDAAESIPWAGVTGKPSTFAPSAHTHDVLKTKPDNWRDGLSLPSTYDVGETIFISSNPTNKFNGISYCTVHTILGYAGFPSCIQYLYPYNVDAPIMYRYCLYNSDSWKDWRKISIEGHTHAIANVSGLQTALDAKMKKGPLTWNDLKGV